MWVLGDGGSVGCVQHTETELRSTIKPHVDTVPAPDCAKAYPGYARRATRRYLRPPELLHRYEPPMPRLRDTIAAVATAQGRGGVGIVRVSGPLAGHIALAVSGRELTPRYANYGAFADGNGQVLDQGLALYFPGPHSFTGEDVLELQGHGGPVVLDLLLRRCLELGARLANPCEFSERAFLNDKLDLAQAEAIADLIEASSEQAARNALRSLQGEFSRRVQ